MNKKGFELSINMIVIIVLAGVLLVLAIVFISGAIRDATDNIKNWPVPTATPTIDDRIVYSSFDLQRGKQNKVTIKVYNNELDAIASDVKPVMTCSGIESVTIDSSGMQIAVGDIGEYNALVTIPSNTPPSSYSCTLTISQTQETLFVEVK